nr:Blo t 21 allergen [Blomia tropicalis]
MKFIIALAALIAVACALPVSNDNFRHEFDHMIVNTATQRFHEIEKFLLHITHEVDDLEETGNKDEKARLLRELTVSEAFIEGSRGYFQRELKRTDLDLLEKFNFEAALATGDLLLKDLKALQKRVQDSE